MLRKEKPLRAYVPDMDFTVEYREPLFLAKEKTGADEKINTNEVLFVNNFRKFSFAIMYCTEHGSYSMRTMIMNEYIKQTNIDEKLVKTYIGTLNIPPKFSGLPVCTIENINDESNTGKKVILFWYQDTSFGKALKNYWHGNIDIQPMNLNIIDEWSTTAAEEPDICLKLISH